MTLVLDTISSPATGSTARRIARAVDRGSSVVNAQGKAFIASLTNELRSGKSPSREHFRTMFFDLKPLIEAA